MRLSGPTLQDELRSPRLRSLRIYMVPAIVAVALYAFYAIGGYATHDPPPKPALPGSIYGTVVDENAKPVSGVSVTISFSSSKEISDSSFTTDSQGHFYMKDLSAGSYILQASANGFDMQTQLTGVQQGKTTQIKLPIYRQSARNRPTRH